MTFKYKVIEKETASNLALAISNFLDVEKPVSHSISAYYDSTTKKHTAIVIYK